MVVRRVDIQCTDIGIDGRVHGSDVEWLVAGGGLRRRRQFGIGVNGGAVLVRIESEDGHQSRGSRDQANFHERWQSSIGGE